MIAFSCGVMSTVAVDRFWPRPRAQCGGGQVVFAAGTPTPDPEALLVPAAAPALSPVPAEVTPLPPAAPAPETKAPPVVVAPAVRTVPPPPARPAAAVAKTPARPTGRTAVVARTPAQGRAAVRKRVAAAPAAAGDTMPPTESWVDPFN
jgi:hypothetical protein